MHTRKYAPRLLTALIFLITPGAALINFARPAIAQEMPAAPPGWSVERDNGSATYAPSNLPEGKVFRLVVTPIASRNGENLRDWFDARIRETAGTLGQMGKRGAMGEAVNGMFTVTQDFRDKEGRVLVVLYAGAPIADDKARFAWIVTSPDKAFFAPPLREAMKIILLASDGFKKKASSSEETPQKATSQKRTPSAPSEAELLRQQYTKRGAGLKPSQIEGVFERGSMETGVGGGMYMTYEPIIALKDGTFYEAFDVPPADFDAATARRLRPHAWGKWRKQGGKYQELNRKGVWVDEEWLGPTVGAGQNAKMTGTYSYLGGGGNTAFGGGTQFAVSRALTFFPDGHLKGGSSVSVSSAEPLSDTSSVVGSAKDYSGTYKFDGYTLELRYNDGRIERKSFAYMDWKKKESFYLNGVAYLKQGKK